MMAQRTLFDDVEKCDNIVEIPYNSMDYPQKLRQIKNYPRTLYAKGNTKLLKSERLVAIVGTRNVSDLGVVKTKEVTEHFTSEGYGVVSGLALGVDTIAIRTALIKGAKVVAVLPCIDIIVPKSNYKLAGEIVDKEGLLLSEHRGKVKKYYFVQRNRIISGLADFVVVVESGASGGTVHTVKFALEQNKDVYVFDDLTYERLKRKGFNVKKLRL